MQPTVKSRIRKAGNSEPVDISTRFKSVEPRQYAAKPTVAKSIFDRFVYHGSTPLREARSHGIGEIDCYDVLRMQIKDRLEEARRIGYMQGRNSILHPAQIAERVA